MVQELILPSQHSCNSWKWCLCFVCLRVHNSLKKWCLCLGPLCTWTMHGMGVTAAGCTGCHSAGTSCFWPTPIFFCKTGTRDHQTRNPAGPFGNSSEMPNCFWSLLLLYHPATLKLRYHPLLWTEKQLHCNAVTRTWGVWHNIVGGKTKYLA